VPGLLQDAVNFVCKNNFALVSELLEVDDLGFTSRGENGFGSTGI
jgi:hypothetical protein